MDAQAPTDLLELEYHLQILRYVSVCLFSVAVWEHLIWLPSELLVWKSLLRKLGIIRPAPPRNGAPLDTSESRIQASLGSITICLLRYSMLVSGPLMITFFLGRPVDCAATAKALRLCFSVTWAAANSIFVARVYVMYGKNKRVLAALGLLWLATIGAWIADIFAYSALRIPDVPALAPWCRTVVQHRWRSTGWGLSMVFDLVVLFMTLWKVHRLQAALPGGNRFGKTEMHRFVLRSNLLWFSIVFVANTTCFVVQLAVNDPVLSHLPTPVGIVGTAIVAARIVFDPSRFKAPVVVPNIFADDYLSSMEAPRQRAPLPSSTQQPQARPSTAFPTSFGEEEQERKELAVWGQKPSPAQYVETLRSWPASEEHRLGQLSNGADRSVLAQERDETTPSFEITPAIMSRPQPPMVHKRDAGF